MSMKRTCAISRRTLVFGASGWGFNLTVDPEPLNKIEQRSEVRDQKGRKRPERPTSKSDEEFEQKRRSFKSPFRWDTESPSWRALAERSRWKSNDGVTFWE